MITTTITPRVSETDGAGHINNVFIPIWFEAGRRNIFRVLTPDLDFSRWRAVIANMNVTYLDQIFYQQDVKIRTWIERIGNKSFTVAEEIWQEERRCAQGSAIYVNFNFESQSSEKLSESARIGLQEFLR